MSEEISDELLSEIEPDHDEILSRVIAENRRLRDTVTELLGEFGLSGSHYVASITREHHARLQARL